MFLPQGLCTCHSLALEQHVLQAFMGLSLSLKLEP